MACLSSGLSFRQCDQRATQDNLAWRKFYVDWRGEVGDSE